MAAMKCTIGEAETTCLMVENDAQCGARHEWVVSAGRDTLRLQDGQYALASS